MLNLLQNLFPPPRHLILLIIAAWIGLLLTEQRSTRYGITKDQINNLTFFSLIAFILGGRISFVLQNVPAFLKSPLGVFSINPDIFDPIGALAAAMLMGFIYCQRQKISLWSSLDALTPFLAMLSTGVGLSHLAAGTAFGKETNLAWGIYLWNAYRHPTQIYEILASLLTFALIWLKKQESHRPGILFLTFAGFIAGSQLFIQAFRGDGTLILFGIRQAQVLAWLALILIFVLLEIQLKKTK